MNNQLPTHCYHIRKINNSDDRETLCTPFMEDVPRAFLYSDKQGIVHALGAYLQTIDNFAHHKNLKLDFDKLEDVSTMEIYSAIRHGKYNLSLNGGILNQSNTVVSYTYPMEWVKKCIMVPLEPELPKYWYVVWPYGRYIYTFGIIGVLCIAVLMRYFDLSHRVGKTSVLRNILHSSALFLYCSNMNIRVPNAAIRVQIFYGWLMIIGFILSAYYMPYLTSYNMKPIFLPPVDTLQQLINAKITVVMPANDLEELRANALETVTALQRLLRELTHSDFQDLIKDFNRSFAYVVSQDQWNFLNRQQRNLIQPYFHLSQICFGSIFMAFPIQLNSTLREPLNDFILRVQENGL